MWHDSMPADPEAQMGALRLCPFRYDTARDDLSFWAIVPVFPLLEYCL